MYERLSVRTAILGAEPWSEGMRPKIHAAWGEGFQAVDIYGLSEVMGPGVAQESPDSPGALQIFDDHFFPEIVDPETGEPVPDGEFGELVITTLTKEAQPVLRYRTRDITRIIPELGISRTASSSKPSMATGPPGYSLGTPQMTRPSR